MNRIVSRPMMCTPPLPVSQGAIPKVLRIRRALVMFEWYNEQGGKQVKEVDCPKRHSKRHSYKCPLCLGFQTIPESLEEWYRTDFLNKQIVSKHTE